VLLRVSLRMPTNSRLRPMIEIHTSQEEMQAAAKVAANVSLQSLHLLSAKVENSLPYKGGRAEAAVRYSHESRGYDLIAPRILLTKAAASVIVKLKGEDGSESNDWTASIEVVMGALYSLPDAPIPDEIDEEAFLAFARVNGLYNCWPYLRVEVNRIAGSMNLGLVLPTLRILPAATTEGGATKRAAVKAGSAGSKKRGAVRVQRKSDHKK